jgi:hypothetical protein
MKRYDFSQDGGFPLTQNRFAYIQAAFTEAINALGAIGGNVTGPMVVSGMEISYPGAGAVTVSDGWFFYAGELIKFTGATVTPGGGEVALVTITLVANILSFFNGSSPSVELDKTSTLTHGATVTDATHFPLLSLANIYKDAGYGFSPSPIMYRREIGSKVVRLKGMTYNTSPSIVTVDTPLFTLPVGFRPAEEQVFTTMGNGSAIAIRVIGSGVVSIAGDIVTSSDNGVWLNISFDVD